MEQLILTPVVIAVVQLIKNLKIKYVSESRFASLWAILIGTGFTFLMSRGGTWQEMTINGIVVGLSSAGLYDLGNKTIRGK